MNKQCRKCKKTRPHSDFGWRKGPKGGAWLICQDCRTKSYLPWNRKPYRPGRRWLYLFEAENGLVKIGTSLDVAKRLSSLQTQSPIGIEELFSIELDEAGEAEQALHTRFKAQHSHGEWFNLSKEDTERIKNYVKRGNVISGD